MQCKSTSVKPFFQELMGCVPAQIGITVVTLSSKQHALK